MHQHVHAVAPVRYRFRFRGNNLSFTWTHLQHPHCPLFLQTFSMRERVGCEVCGYTPQESARFEPPVY